MQQSGPCGVSPTARSLAYLRKSGALAGVVGKWNPHAKRRLDLFGYIDIVAIWGGHPGWTLGVQTTTAENISHRLTKLREECEPSIRRWMEAGNRLVIHGWGKRGPRGKRKTWTLTEREITLYDDPDLTSDFAGGQGSDVGPPASTPGGGR